MLNVIGQFAQIDAANVLERVMCPIVFQFARPRSIVSYTNSIRIGIQSREVSEQLLEHFADEVAVLVLVPLNVRDHLACWHHLLIAVQIIEEDAFQYQNGDERLEERRLCARVVAERSAMNRFRSRSTRSCFQYSNISFCS